MSNISPRNDDQEVDLSEMRKSLFNGVNNVVFNSIQFLIRHIIMICVLLALGIGLGIYLDQVNKTYDHQIIVTPNFGSTDYLYSKIDLIESKIKERDNSFLQSIGLPPKKLTKIVVEPIIDIYRFINNNSEQNFALLKLMADDNDIKKIVEEKTTSKNYPYHVITFTTRNLITKKETVEPLLKYLNNSTFYSQIQKEYVNNARLKMQANELTIAQIDGVLNGFSNAADGAKKENLVYYNENTQLNDVIETKQKLVTEQGNRRIEMVSLDKIIKESSVITNIKNTETVNGKMKLILPLLFVLIYVAINVFVNFYKTQSSKTRV